MIKEKWKDVIGYEGKYQVSNYGQVKSLASIDVNGKLRRGKLMAPQDTARYPKVVFKRGKPTMKYIHRLVLEAFSGPCPPNCEARHLDGNRLNNSLINLEWGTRKDNQADRIKHGTDMRGENHPNTTLKTGQVVQVRSLSGLGWTYKELAEEFGVSIPAIGRIVRRESWSHIPPGAAE